MSTKLKIESFRGDNLIINLAFTDKDTGAAIDITGWTVFFTAKAVVDNDPTDASAILKKTVTVHTDPTAGESQIAFTAAETNAIPVPISYLYDIQYKTDTDVVKTILNGELHFDADITRRVS